MIRTSQSTLVFTVLYGFKCEYRLPWSCANHGNELNQPGPDQAIDGAVLDGPVICAAVRASTYR